MKSYLSKSGHILAFTIIILAIVFILTSVVLMLLKNENFSAGKSLKSKQALSLAESGVDYAIRKLNDNPTYSGESNLALGNGEVSIIVTGSGATRTIESSGAVPSFSAPLSKRTVRMDAVISGQLVGFRYGLQVDSGGVTMGNGAGIVGNLYSNGNVIGSPGATVSGDAIVAGGISNDPSLEWPGSSPSNTAFATNNNNQSIAQSFTATATGALNKVSLKLSKTGSLSSNLSLYLTTDAGDKPATTSLTSVAIPYSMITSTPAWIDTAFPDSINLTNDTKYWLVLNFGSNNANNYWNWQSESGYVNNTLKTTEQWSKGNSSWVDLSTDALFRLWIGGTATSLASTAVGSPTSGKAQANSYINTTVRSVSCPNVNCPISNPPREELPVSDGNISVWQGYAAVGGTMSAFSLTNGTTFSLGPKKITGDFVVSNNSTLIITGDLWITGNLTLSNNCNINLDPSFNGLSGTIVVDGTVTISNNCIFQNNSSTAGYILLLTTRDAKNDVSMSIQNNSAGVIYYCGKSLMEFSQNASAKEATAWGIRLQNNATITYESGLATTNFTGGPGAGWITKKGSWREL